MTIDLAPKKKEKQTQLLATSYTRVHHTSKPCTPKSTIGGCEKKSKNRTAKTSVTRNARPKETTLDLRSLSFLDRSTSQALVQQILHLLLALGLPILDPGQPLMYVPHPIQEVVREPDLLVLWQMLAAAGAMFQGHRLDQGKAEINHSLVGSTTIQDTELHPHHDRGFNKLI
jgi:hypothetical protein